jgi:hypothetical protein
VNISSLVADIEGHQRKVVSAAVRPARVAHGSEGVAVRNGRTLPFVVERAWNAPAGHYREAWYVVHPETREVFYEGPERLVSIWGLQSWTELDDTGPAGVTLPPGKYLLVFALGGVMGGQTEFDASEVGPES